MQALFSNKGTVLAICLMAGLAFYLLYLSAAAAIYGRRRRFSRNHRKDDWLFSDFSGKLYDAFFGGKDPDAVALKMGFDIEKYYKNCALLKEKPDTAGLVMNFTYGIIAFAVCCVLACTVSLYFAFAGVGFLLLFIFYKQRSLESRTSAMRLEVEDELPRFLDLLHPELEIGIPVENAIYRLCMNTDYLLSREFMDAFNEVELGAKGWQQALEQVASKYDVDILNTFVLTITSAYNKGVSVADTVQREAFEIRQTYLLHKKESAGKMTNTVLIPVAILQFVPLVAFMLVPAFAMFMESF